MAVYIIICYIIVSFDLGFLDVFLSLLCFMMCIFLLLCNDFNLILHHGYICNVIRLGLDF